MAQQNLDFNIVAHTKGMEQIASLINRVGALEAEINKVKTANAGLAASSDAVIRGGVRYNNAIDAQSKALRNARQGTQQLGMQINDFATSVSTGASPIQAFNQQIGQVGFAMSMMGGTAGKVGAFLAGPWGAAITIATMGLGMLWENFMGAEESAKDFRDVMVDQTAAFDDVIVAVTSYNDEIDKQRQDTLALLGLQKQSIRARVHEAMAIWQEVIALQARQAELNSQRSSSIFRGQSGMAGLVTTRTITGQVNEAQTALGELQQALLNTDWEINEEETRRAGRAARDTADNNRDLADSLSAVEIAARDLGIAYRAGSVSFDEFMRGLRQVNALQEAEDSTRNFVENVRQIGAAIQESRAQESFQQLRGELRSINAEATQNAQAFQMLWMNANPLPILQQPVKLIATEMRDAFDSIGQSVNDAFRGMVTGATSWKDAMRSIINSVIDQLWKLYVTQQIVGFISQGMQSIGLPLPGKAIGGAVSAKTPYMVGERGPELFIPGGNGTIIPNNNLSSGGGSVINVTVDARGAGDPAAVDARVRQGIMEAAPMIIAASQQRTIAAQSRPRLGGAIK